MTVIAWDGYTLAADKRATNGSLIRTTTKIFRIHSCLVGYAGEATFGEQMIAWFQAGEKAEDFPKEQRDKDDWAPLLVIRENGKIHKYERTPHPLKYQDKQFAIGSGRDFALAAMACGKTASEAVEVASMFDSNCGNGVDTLRLL
jgi:ATP-dependent protease HslVU (ClpYQ) peptidase subunit